MSGAVREAIKKVAKGSGTQTVAVYSSVASGQFQYALVFRMKDGLKEFREGYRKPFKERYKTANGEGIK